VNIPLTIAFGFLIEAIFSKKENLLRWPGHMCIWILMIGFFLISELFAAAVLAMYFLKLVYCFWKASVPLSHIIPRVAVAFLVIVCGVYLTGGIVGDMIGHSLIRFQSTPTSPSVSIPEQGTDIGEHLVPTTALIISVKPILTWGYPSEKRVLVPWDIPLYYLRSVLLEVSILLLWSFLLVTRRIVISDKPVLVLLMLMGLVGPFILTTRFGDLNLAKTTTLSFVLLHLLIYYWLTYIEGRKRVWLTGFFLVLFAISAISGFLMGPNIQWQIVSGKGREQYCSQNPVCYKGEFTDMLQIFERENPGLKRVRTDQKNAAKVVDLTNAYVYRSAVPGVGYVVETPELRKGDTRLIEGEILYESGEYRIWRIN
jgi:hypothetical protein